MSKSRREEIRKKQKNKKIIAIIAAVLSVVIIASVVVALNVHSCDECGKTFTGSGYYKEKESQGVLGSVFGTIFGDTEGVPLETVEDVTICRDCAMNNVSVKSELRGVEEFKK